MVHQMQLCTWLSAEQPQLPAQRSCVDPYGSTQEGVSDADDGKPQHESDSQAMKQSPHNQLRDNGLCHWQQGPPFLSMALGDKAAALSRQMPVCCCSVEGCCEKGSGCC